MRWRSSRSIYEHILAHVEPGVPGLQPCGEALPDEDALAAGGPGGEPPLENEQRVDVLHRALLELAERPGRRTRSALTALFRTGAQTEVVHALGTRLRREPPSDPEALYDELRTILLETRSRDELKFAIVVVGTYQREENADVFRVLARHEEFTLFAAKALAYGADDWVGECLAVLPETTDSAATELSRLLLHTQDARVISSLLRRSPTNGHALDLAVGWLCEALESGEADDDLQLAARSILDGLTWSFSEPAVHLDGREALIAAERFLELLTERASTLDALITAYELGSALEPADDEHARRAQELSREIVARRDWRVIATAALESDDRDERALGIEAARRLGIPLGDHLVRSLKTDPGDSWLWYHFVAGAGTGGTLPG